MYLYAVGAASQAVAYHHEAHASWLIGLQAGLIAALAVGLLDHYYFNIEFSHMTALLWYTVGLLLAIMRNGVKSEDNPA